MTPRAITDLTVIASGRRMMMKLKIIANSKFNTDQRGAALVTVIMISVLLLTASIALLSAVGANSRNSTDILSETKAYYAAESGLQATINYLRNTDGMTYSTALNQQDGGTLPVTGPNAVGSETTYTIQITDPDNARASTTYTTAGFFAVDRSGPWEITKYFPNSTDANRTELTFIPPAGAPITFSHPDSAPFPELGSFRITTFGTGGTMTEMLFRIDYFMTKPRPDTRSIRGTIVINGSIPEVRYDEYEHTLSGGTIALCPDSDCTVSGTTFADIPLSVPASGSADTAVYAKIGPVDPHRLLVLATGFGPNRAIKRLEGIIQKNFFNDSAGGSPLQAMGPNADVDIGPSNQLAIDGGSSPAIGVCDAASLDTVNQEAETTNGEVTPAPAITCQEVPTWLQSPITLDPLIRQLRQAAINSGRYFTNGGPTNTQGWGKFADGTGLTFCEGNCTFGGTNEGGGILVVTGTLTTSGSPKFKGLVLITGPGGIVRNGGGNEIFIGQIIVAPYDPNNLTATWEMTPIYDQQGGPGDLVNSSIAIDDAFNGTAAISNFMLGIAEK